MQKMQVMVAIQISNKSFTFVLSEGQLNYGINEYLTNFLIDMHPRLVLFSCLHLSLE
jgi:hypothetical protein